MAGRLGTPRFGDRRARRQALAFVALRNALLAAGVVLLLAPAPALASHSSGKGPARDFAVGGGKTASDIFNISAHSGPGGENARGHMKAKNTKAFGASDFTFDFEGDVLCLTVIGNRATVAGRLTKVVVNGAPASFQGIVFFVEDNRALGGPDRYTNFLTVNPVTVCPPPGPTPFDVLNGNIVVHDG